MTQALYIIPTALSYQVHYRSNNSEEVGHGHVIFVRRRIYIEVSVLKSVVNFNALVE